MAGSRIDFANASNVMRLQKSGARFSPQTMAAARRILSGNGNASDSATVRQALGIFKTGASKAKNALRAAQQAQSTIVQVGTSIEQISRGGGAGGVGFVNLVKLGTDELDKIVRSRTVRTVFEQVGKTFWGNAAAGTRAYQSFRGSMRVGGAIVQAAIAGWEIGKAIQGSEYSNVDKRNARQGLSFDIAKKNMIDYARARSQSQSSANNASVEEGFINSYLHQSRSVFGWEFFGGFDTGYEDSVKKQAMQRAANTTAARAQAGEILGRGGVENILAQAAAEKGKSIAELTDYEKAQALDTALEGIFNTSDQQSQQEIDNELALETPAEKFGDGFLTQEQREAKRRRIGIEKIVPNRIRYYETRASDRETAVERAERIMTPQERFDNRKAEDVTQAQWLSVKSRHRAWNND